MSESFSNIELNEIWDKIILILLTGGGVVISLSYPHYSRQIPLTFLIVAFIAILLEMLINAFPDTYLGNLQPLTQGISSEVVNIEEQMQEDTEKPPQQQNLQIGIREFLKPVFLLFGFTILTILIGFLYSIPFFIFGTYYLMGDFQIVKALAYNVLFLGISYIIFGQIMNVPIQEGVLL